jgi:hypothetical protein
MYDPQLEDLDVKNLIRSKGVDDMHTNVSAMSAMGGRRSLTRLSKAKVNLRTLTISTINYSQHLI